MSNTVYVDYREPAVNAEWLNEINDHVWSDTPVTGTTVHNASTIKNIPSGTISSTTVQDALNEIIIDYADPTGSALIGYKQSGTGAVNQLVQTKLRESISVKDFGAVGDGVTDDTAAIQAAINAAQTLIGTDYWQSNFKSVFIPPGVYQHTGLVIDKPIEVYGTSPQQCSLVLKNNANSSALTIYATPNSVVTNDSFRQHVTIKGLALNCNSTNQTGTSYGIYLPDSHNAMETRYDGSVNLIDVIIRAAKNSNIYVGQNRNNGSITRVSSIYSTEDGLTMLGYDWRISDSDFGNNTSAGIRFNTGGAHSIEGTYIYRNGDAGMVCGPFVVASNTIDGCYIDSNAKSGIYLEGSSLNYVIHCINNTVFRDNGTLTLNTYPHIYLKNLQQTIISGCSFVVNKTSVRANYLVFTDNSPQVSFTGMADLVNATTKPYATAVTNDVTKIVDESFIYDSWVAYTPTVSSGSGTITAASATGKYRKKGKVVHWEGTVTITTNGTGATWVGLSLPFVVGGFSNQSHFAIGRNATSGGAIFGEFPATGNVVAIRKYDDTYPGANGVTLALSGTYQTV